MTLAADGPPLGPSSPQAREWLREELSHRGYDTQPSWWQRFVEWLQGHSSGSGGPGLPAWALAGAVVLLLLALAVVLLTMMRRETVTGQGLRRRRPLLDEPATTASSYRRRAVAALDRADWDAALLDGYRALAVGAQERTLVSELPGRTAHEVADALVPFFPVHRAELIEAARAFDEVRYGRRPATATRARQVVALEDAVRQETPRFDTAQLDTPRFETTRFDTPRFDTTVSP